MQQGVVFDIKKYSVHDGPGIRTTVFLKGCPLTCWWCHNPESQQLKPQLLFYPQRCIGCGQCVSVCKNQALDKGEINRELCKVCGVCTAACPSEALELAGTLMTVGQVMQEVNRDRIFYDESGGGITFSGGEPLMQADFLMALLQQCCASGLHTAVDTTGFAQTEVISEVATHTDLFLYDLKHMDNNKHLQFTGVPNTLILRNLKVLAEMKANIIVRVPIMPGINDSRGHIDVLIDYILALPREVPVNLLPYHRAGKDKYQRLGLTYQMEGIDEPSLERMREIEAHFISSGIKVQIGG